MKSKISLYTNQFSNINKFYHNTYRKKPYKNKRSFYCYPRAKEAIILYIPKSILIKEIARKFRVKHEAGEQLCAIN